jgi:cytochrome c556
LKAFGAVAFAVMLGLASCSGSPQPVAPPQAPAAKTAAPEAVPQPEPAPAAELSAEAGRMPDMPPRTASLDRMMRAHFHDSLLIRQAVVAGRYEQAVGPARVLSVVENDETFPASWREFINPMQNAARRVSKATSLEQAAAATADLAATCGQCHERLGGPHVSAEPRPGGGATIEAWMKRHQWAGERLWEGLVGPSEEAWSAGAQALAASPVPSQLLADEGSQGRRAADALARLVAKAPQLTDSEARTALYAELLVTCGDCHRAVKRRRTE